MRRIAFTIGVLALSMTSTFAADTAGNKTPTVRQMVQDLNPMSVIWFWEETNLRCENIETDNRFEVCLIRSEIGEVLKSRGFCESDLPENGSHWKSCVVEN